MNAQSYAGSGEDRVRGVVIRNGTTNTFNVLLQTQGGYGVGGTNVAFSATPAVLVHSLDESHRVEWATPLRATVGVEGLAMVPAGDGGIVFGGAFEGVLQWQTQGVDQHASSFGIPSGFVARLEGRGEIQWVRTLGGTEQGRVLAVAHKSGVGLAATGFYVGQGMFPGVSLPGRTATQLFVCKLSESGDAEWVRDIGGGESALGMGLDMDAQGSVFVGGQFVDVTAMLPVPDGAPSRPASVVADRIRTGPAPAAGSVPDGFVGAWASDGKPQWYRVVGGPGIDRVTSVVVRGDRVYAAGFLERGGGINSLQIPPGVGGQWFLMAFDTTGRPLWEAHATGNQFSEAHAVAADDQGNVYVTGYFNGAPVIGFTQLNAAGTDTFIAKFDSNGTFLWAVQTGNTAIVVGTALSVAGDGSMVSFGGYTRGTPSFGGASFPAAGGRDGFLATFKAPPDAPRITWTRMADGLELHWQFPEAGLHLEYRTNLLGRTLWRRFEAAPEVDAQSGTFRQRVPFSNAVQAFRLRR